VPLADRLQVEDVAAFRARDALRRRPRSGPAFFAGLPRAFLCADASDTDETTSVLSPTFTSMRSSRRVIAATGAVREAEIVQRRAQASHVTAHIALRLAHPHRRKARVLDAGDLVLECRDLGVELGEAVGGRLLAAVDGRADTRATKSISRVIAPTVFSSVAIARCGAAAPRRAGGSISCR
jgi:hypothetical protein